MNRPHRVSGLAPPPGQFGLVCDSMLGRLARWLRILGFDTTFRASFSEQWLAAHAEAQGRILVTRDTRLVRRPWARGRSILVLDNELERQIAMVARETALAESRMPQQAPPCSSPRILDAVPGTRCVMCNGEILPAPRETVALEVPEYTLRTADLFYRCFDCGRVTWEGTHMDRAREFYRQRVQPLSGDFHLYFATGNRAKLAQMEYVASRAGIPARVIPVYSLFGKGIKYLETGSGPLEIASRGAVQLGRVTGRIVVTEDTVIQIAALSGGPGNSSDLYLKREGIDGVLAAVSRALTGSSGLPGRCGAGGDLQTGLGGAGRGAVITSAVAVAGPGGLLASWVNRVEGTIAGTPRWIGGEPSWVGPVAGPGEEGHVPFGGGYNSIFEPASLGGRTLAEATAEEGLTHGYREPNFRKALEFVREASCVVVPAKFGTSKPHDPAALEMARGIDE